MPDSNLPRFQGPAPDGPPPRDEGGLHAPPGLSVARKVWWWFDFVILVNLARLRFIILLAVIGLVIIYWDELIATYERWTRPTAQAKTGTSETEYYCPMHTNIIRDNPKDKCPICAMPLSPRKKGKPETLPPGIVSRKQFSPYQVVQAGIQTSPVEFVALSKEIATVGYVEFNEREMKQITVRVKGRLDTLYVNETGEMVHANQELALLYSPELMVTVQNLIDAGPNASLRANARKRLELAGIGADQIAEIEKTGKANTHLKIRSPIDGHVIKKYVKEGQYVDEGSPLYDVVDLSTVWIQAQVYEEDMAFLPYYHRPLKKEQAARLGLPMTATTRAVPGQIFEGKLTFVFPHVDEDTRSVIVRFELDNPNHKLRPGTTATVKLKIPARQLEVLSKTLTNDWVMESAAHDAFQALFSPFSPALGSGLLPQLKAAERLAALHHGLVLAVPDSAVIDTGKLQIVYRQVMAGEFEGVKVELGPRMTGRDDVPFYPVLRGLDPGDLVVTNPFLVDAETRLNPAAGSIYFGGGTSKGTQPGPGSVRPSTPDDEESKAKVALAKLPKADRRLAELQGFCPILEGSPLGSMGVPVKVTIQGQPVFLCCKNCEKGAVANPKKTLEDVAKLKAKAKAQN